MTLDGTTDDASTWDIPFNYVALISAIFHFFQSDANFKCHEDDLFCEFTCCSFPNDVPTWVYIENNYWSLDWENLNSHDLLDQSAIEVSHYYCILYWNHPGLQAIRNHHKPDSSDDYDFLFDLLWALGFSGVGEIEWYAISDFYTFIESEISKSVINSPDQIA
ncbi:hypothetical protein [Leptolyngbya sp. NIES-2104]|uniref:hypothetical protein n=1 Tax=Leptolyngbya sp. NIES-2104 TaxID=1552121 RepID=UPI00073E3DC3|nr:hypothetical protein [Leptolyngbya sp. NIES-2104]